MALGPQSAKELVQGDFRNRSRLYIAHELSSSMRRRFSPVRVTRRLPPVDDDGDNNQHENDSNNDNTL
eukprot:2378311-Rhodomonas_salina.1